jgi:hypothetical protein
MLLVINPLLKFISRRLSLARNELLTVYITCLFSALVPGHGSENFFVPNLLASFYFATQENQWLEWLQPYVKPWITPAITADGQYNRALVEGWYVGLKEGESIPWGAWLVPLVAWCSLIFALHWMLGCLGVMLRAQWSDREALSFPLLRLPLEMTQDMDKSGTMRGWLPPFFRSTPMWIGFGISAGIELLNGLNLYYPDIPPVTLSLRAGDFLTQPPWDQIGGLGLRVYPALVGITYLLTSEVSFSLWFFYLFMKFQLIIAWALGFMPNAMPAPYWTRGIAKSFIGYQQFGAYFGYVAVLLWLARDHFKHIALRAFGRTPATPAEAGEPLSYPTAFWGFTLALSFILLWTVAAGVSLPLALLLWGSYLVISLGLTRIAIEGGLVYVHTGWVPLGPLSLLFGGGPGKLIDPAGAVPASFISSSLMFEMRAFLLPSFVQSFKLARDQKIALKPLLALIAVVTVIAFSISVYMMVVLGYRTGGLQLQAWVTSPWAAQPALTTAAISKGLQDNFAANWAWCSLGAMTAIAMMAARSRFMWFPFHPIGLLMCVPWAMSAMWVSIFLGWLIKCLTIRYAGNTAARNLAPAFLGVVLGTFVMAVFWVGVDAWQGRSGHVILP